MVSGQRPAPFAVKLFDRIGSLGVRVLDSLGFIENHHVPIAIPECRIIAVGTNGFIAAEEHLSVCGPPQPRPGARRANNGGKSQFGCPAPEFAAPLKNEASGSYDQHRASVA